MADATKAWDKAFTHGSKAMQDRLKKVHEKNPAFQSWLKASGHAAGTSVKQASKEVKPSERVKNLQAKSAQAYGATKGVKVGGEFGSGEMRDTVKPLTKDQWSKVQAAERAAKVSAKPAPAAKKPLSTAERMAAIGKAVKKAKSKERFDVPTVNPDDADHDDLMDVHQSLHVRRGYNEETKPDASMAMTDTLKIKMISDKDKRTLGKVAALMASQKNKDKKNAYVRQLGLKAMKAGKVDPARGHSPTRFGREVLRKEEIELDEVTKKEAEAMLGGPTKEKPKMPPGKQPAGYRYVRGLARKAMKAGLKKEEVELDEMDKSQPSSSRGAEGLALGKKANPVKPDKVKSDALKLLQKQYKKVKEEVEQIDEVKKLDASMAMTNQLRMKAISDKDKKTLGKVADLMAAQRKLDKKNMKEESEMQYIEEKLSAADPASKWISDFVASDNPKFAGKSKKERINQALGAYYAAKRGKNEEAEQIDEANMRFDYEAAARPKSSDVKNFLNRDKNARAAAASKKYIRRMTKLGGLGPNQTKKDTEAHMKAYFEEVEQIDEQSPAEIKAKYYHDQFDKVKPVKAYDKEGKLVGRYRSMDHAKQMKPGHTYKVEEEVVTEAEGKVAVTPKEKDLAAHHGDKTRITYGDVIKARLKSAAAKKMGK